MPYLETTRTGTASCDISMSWEVTVYPAATNPFTAKKVGWVDGLIGGIASHTGAYSTWTWSQEHLIALYKSESLNDRYRGYVLENLSRIATPKIECADG